MSDLVKRLRELETKLPTTSDNWIEARELQLEAAARIEALEAALLLASNRFARVRLEFDQSDPMYFEIGEWRNEAHAASLLEPK